jgi:hypothetical protein
MDAKTFSLVAGLIFALVALLHLVRIFEEWPVHHRGLVSAEVGELGSAHCRWWPRPSRAEAQRAKRIGQFRLATQ